MWLLGLFALFFGGLAIFGTVLNKKAEKEAEKSHDGDAGEKVNEEKKENKKKMHRAKKAFPGGKKFKIMGKDEEKSRKKKEEPATAPTGDFGNDMLNAAIESFSNQRSTPKVDAPTPVPKKTDSVLKNASSLVGEDGLLYSYCMDNASKLYTHRIKSLGSSIKYIKEHPEFAEKLVNKVNALEPEHYETALTTTLEEIKAQPKNEELRVVRDTLLAVIYTTGVSTERDSFLKRERAFDETKADFVDEIKDERLRTKFQALVTTSKGKTESLSERAQEVDGERVITQSVSKPEAIKKVIALAHAGKKEDRSRKAA